MLFLSCCMGSLIAIQYYKLEGLVYPSYKMFALMGYEKLWWMHAKGVTEQMQAFS